MPNHEQEKLLTPSEPDKLNLSEVIMNGLKHKDFNMKVMGGKVFINYAGNAFMFDAPDDLPSRMIKALDIAPTPTGHKIVEDEAAQDGQDVGKN